MNTLLLIISILLLVLGAGLEIFSIFTSIEHWDPLLDFWGDSSFGSYPMSDFRPKLKHILGIVLGIILIAAGATLLVLVKCAII